MSLSKASLPKPIKAELQCHPATPAQAGRGVEAQVAWGHGGALTLTFALELEGPDADRVSDP